MRVLIAPAMVALIAASGCLDMENSTSLSYRGNHEFSKDGTVHCGGTGTLTIEVALEAGAATVQVSDAAGAELVQRRFTVGSSGEERRVEGPSGDWQLKIWGDPDYAGFFKAKLTC